MIADQMEPKSMTRAEAWRYHIAALVVLAALVLVHQYRQVLFLETPRMKDTTELYEPLRAYYAASLKEGRIPIWCPTLGIGLPFLAYSDDGVFYPPNLIIFRFLDSRTGELVVGILRRYLGGVLMYAAARGLGLGFWGGLLSAIAFMFNGFLAVSLWAVPSRWGWMELPLMVLAAERLVTRRGAWTIVWTSLAVGVALLVGHFQFQFMGLLLFLWVGVWRTLQLRGGMGAMARRALRLALPLILGAALAAVQLLPTWELKPLSPRAGDFELQTADSYPPERLLMYVFPFLYTHGGDWRWMEQDTSVEGTLSYIGLLPILLVPLAWRRRRAVATVPALFGAAALFTLLSFAANLPGYLWLIKLPGFGYFSRPGRYVMAAAVCLALLAGAGLETAARATAAEGRRWVRWAVGGLVAMLVLAVMSVAVDWLTLRGRPGVPDFFRLAPQTTLGLLMSLPAVVASVAVLILLVRQRPSAPVLVIVVVAADLTGLWLARAAQREGHQAEPQPPEVLARPGAILAHLPPPDASRHGGHPHSARPVAGYRTLAFGMNFMPRRAYWVAGLGDLGGRRYQEVAPLYRMLHVRYLISRKPQDDPNLRPLYEGPDAQAQYLHGRRVLWWRLFEVTNPLPRPYLVDHAVWCATEEEVLKIIEAPAFDVDHVVVLEGAPSVLAKSGDSMPGLPSQPTDTRPVLSPDFAAGPPGTCRIEEERERLIRITVEAHRPAWLVLSDLHYPGWVATVNGHEVDIERANYVCRAIRVPEGRSEVVFAYRPWTVTWGARVSAATLALLVLMTLVVAARQLDRRGGNGGTG